MINCFITRIIRMFSQGQCNNLLLINISCLERYLTDICKRERVIWHFAFSTTSSSELIYHWFAWGLGWASAKPRKVLPANIGSSRAGDAKITETRRRYHGAERPTWIIIHCCATMPALGELVIKWATCWNLRWHFIAHRRRVNYVAKLPRI